MGRVRIGFKSGKEISVTTEMADKLSEKMEHNRVLLRTNEGELLLMVRADSIDYMRSEVCDE